MTLPMVHQHFYTARELAEIALDRGLANFPTSERRVRDYAAREGWNDLPQVLSRWREDPAGGRPAREYHQSLLPELMQAVLSGRMRQAVLSQELVAQSEADRRKVAAVKAAGLSARSRGVMEARAEVLLSIDGYAVSRGQTRAWAIGRFLEAQGAFQKRQEIEARRDAGEILTAKEISVLSQPLLLSATDGFHLLPGRLAIANDRGAKPTVGRATIYNWFKLRDASGATALSPAPTKEVAPIPRAFGEFLKFYAKPGKPSIADAHKKYMEDAEKRNDVQLMTLTLSQCRHILRDRLNNIEKHIGREGFLTLRSRLPYVTRTTEDMWPTTIYSADGKTFDAEIADPATRLPIRPEITTVIDIVTRKVVGISLARSENQRSVAEALRNACVGSGIPAIFYVDRGPGYRNEAMDADVSGLMGRLGITKMHAAPYGSQAKGRIERPNATIWDTLAKRLPTYIGSDMDMEAGKKIFRLTRRDLKEFGSSRLLPSWDEFVALCAAMVEEYNDKPHRGLPKFEDPATGKLRHMNPNEAWAAHVAAGFEPVPVEPDEVDDLFRPYVKRVARRCIVEWNSNQFFDLALEAYHKREVMVGYDYHQADRVWVREFDVESGQPGKLICVAAFQGNAERYVPLSYEQAAQEARTKGRLRRVDVKRDAIEQEHHALMIEAMAAPPMPVFEVPEAAAAPIAAESGPAQPRRRTFASDEELAAWALAHPTEVTAGQLSVLKDCMARPAAREVFRMAGIDTEALRTLLRAAA